MCGLVGVMSSNMLQKHKDLLSLLLFFDTLRGRDSTGVAAIRNNADTEVLKATIPGHEFTEGPRLHSFLRLNDFLWIGHNRYGTVGRNIKTNAHPFTIDDEDGACLIVGAHNGTIKNKQVFHDHQLFGTDSEALYNNVAIDGLKETLAKADGAWALTFYDHIEEEFRVVRNKERPLFYAFEKDKKTMFWASESWMLRVACERLGIEIEDRTIHSFAIDTLYKMKAPMKMNEVLVFEREEGYTGYEAPPFRHPIPQKAGGNVAKPAGGTFPSQSQKLLDLNSNSGTKNSSSSSTVTKTTPSQDSQKQQSTNNSGNGNVVPLEAGKTYKGYGNQPLSRNELLEQLQNGCSWCGSVKPIDISSKFAFLKPNEPVCQSCIDGDTHEKALFEGMLAAFGGSC